MEIRLKRIYETPSEADGLRVLVDRLWPRGIKKDDAKVDLWVKTLAPTTALRKWFDHDVAKWNEFRTMYSDEIRNNDDFKTLLERISAEPVVTLLFGAKDTEHNNAVVLADMVKNTL